MKSKFRTETIGIALYTLPFLTLIAMSSRSTRKHGPHFLRSKGGQELVAGGGGEVWRFTAKAKLLAGMLREIAAYLNRVDSRGVPVPMPPTTPKMGR
jgi:hypothetical protein